MTIRRSFADAAGGVAGSLVAMLVFYPIDVLKVNLQADKGNSNDNDTTEISKKRNITNMVRIMRFKYPSNLDFLKALFKGLHLKLAHSKYGRKCLHRQGDSNSVIMRKRHFNTH